MVICIRWKYLPLKFVSYNTPIENVDNEKLNDWLKFKCRKYSLLES